MSMLLHIFRKDVRHFFPEILVNFALFVVFAWTAPYTWLPDYGPHPSNLFVALLRALLPIVWLVMIARVLQDEVLVGDRQFWITRPYRRDVLLGAKVLFLLVFLHIPFFLMQCYLLHTAGLPVFATLGRLLAYQSFLAGVVVMPLAGIAVVTATFARQFLSVLAGLVYLLGVAALLGWYTDLRMTPPYVDRICWTIAIATIAGVIVAMYARRPVREARIALLALPLVLVGIAVSLPTRLLVQHVYASAATDTLTFNPDPKEYQTSRGEPRLINGNVELRFPVLLHMVSDRGEATIRGTEITLAAGDGTTWTSPVEGPVTYIHPDTPQMLPLRLPLDVFRRMSSQSVTVKLRLATERFAFPAMQSIVVPASGHFTLSNGGVCTLQSDFPSLLCTYALRTPPPVAVALELQREPCDQSGTRSFIHRRTDGATAGLSHDFDPVATQGIPLYLRSPQDSEREDPAHLCPSARAAFATEQDLGREHLELTATSVSLGLYAERHGR